MSVAAQFEANASEDLSSPFYFNASHWRAMDGIVEGVKGREGIHVMTGPTGSGKTMLMRAISENLGEGVTPLFLQYASLNFREFVNFLHNSLNVADEIIDASNKAVALRKFLYNQAERHESAVVFVDEAQNLEPDVLRMLPKLACFDQLEDGTNVGLQFMLTGGSELKEMLEDPDFAEVRDSVARRFELRFFTREELTYFLEKRLAPLARMTPEPITVDAIEAVGKYTGGSPRLIGMICSHAMLFAAENPGRSIDESMIEEAAEALMIEPAENPFAHEEEELSGISGPFSSADLTGEETASDEADEEEVSDSPLTAMPDEAFSGSPELAPVDSEDEFDTSEMASVMDEMGTGLDVDNVEDDLIDDVDDLANDDFEGIDTPVAVKSAVGGAGLAGMLSRFSRGKSKKGLTSQIVGAGRKGRNSGRSAAPTQKRSMKTRIAGRRQKQIKYAGYAAGLAALAFGAYMVRADVSRVFASAKNTVVATVTPSTDDIAVTNVPSGERGFSPTVETSMTETMTSPQSFETASLDVDASETVTTNIVEIPPAPEALPSYQSESVVEVPASPAIDPAQPAPIAERRGWGAQVEVLQPLPKPAKPDVSTGPKLPEKTVGLAQGALDLIDVALDKSKTVLPEDMGGAIDVAKGDVQNLRTAAATSGVTGKEREERLAKLVAEGDKFFAQGLYIAPARGNAYDSYRSALDIDAENEGALRGIENLRSFYSKKAESARTKKQWDRANRFFETALGISQRKPVR